jgi:hypothetical protein
MTGSSNEQEKWNKPFCNANTNYWIKKLEAFTSPQFVLDCKFLVKYARDI